MRRDAGSGAGIDDQASPRRRQAISFGALGQRLSRTPVRFCGSGWWVFSVQADSAGRRCCSEQGADPCGRVLASDRAGWRSGEEGTGKGRFG